MSIPQTFAVNQPTRIHFGCGALSRLPEVLAGVGGERVFLVMDPGLDGTGIRERITGLLAGASMPYELYDGIDPEPGLRLADEGARRARGFDADCVVGVGGGSAMDVAKAVSILLTNGGRAADYIGLDKIARPGVPKVMVPTTAGTGAEVTFTAVFINEETGSKGGMNGDPLYPEAAILDPELTRTLPPGITAATGIDAFTHALEAYVSTAAHPISDLYAREAIARIARALPVAYANGDNMEARSDMLLGSLLAGKALATAGVGLVHAMAYPLGGMYNIPHGLANAVLLPYVVEYNIIGSPARFADIAGLMGYDTTGLPLVDAARRAVDAVFNLTYDVGIPDRLADLGVEENRIAEMADVALTVARPVANNPRRPSRDDVIHIYETAFEGYE